MILCVSIAVPVLFLGISLANQTTEPAQTDLFVSSLENNVAYLLNNPDKIINQTLFFPESCSISSNGNSIQVSWASPAGIQYQSISAPMEIIVTENCTPGWNQVIGYIENNALYIEFVPLVI